MYLGQEYKILGDWFIIHFTENPGMAFGLELGGASGKLILTIFRVCVACFGAWYLSTLIRDKAHPGFISAGALILAGAVGNIIDSIFYAKLFSESYNSIAQFMPIDGGYGDWLHGHVVDMLYFPVIQTHFPSWFPIWPGEEFIFFQPVFNIADTSISFGIGLILVFQKQFFKTPAEEKQEDANPMLDTDQPK